jgi:hypothetical protein
MKYRFKVENRLRKAWFYRERAITMRGLAARERDQSLKKAMLALADDYEGYYKNFADGSARSEVIRPEN